MLIYLNKMFDRRYRHGFFGRTDFEVDHLGALTGDEWVQFIAREPADLEAFGEGFARSAVLINHGVKILVPVGG